MDIHGFGHSVLQFFCKLIQFFVYIKSSRLEPFKLTHFLLIFIFRINGKFHI